MNEVILPPSPNWYQSTSLVCANDKSVAWASRNIIIVIKYSENHKFRDYCFIHNAHSEKINSLAFSPLYGEPGNNLLVSAGEEHIIRVWNLDTCDAVLSQSYPDSHQKVVGVDWSRSDPTLICSVSGDGSLVAWNISNNSQKAIFLGKVIPMCISCCPHKANLVALGLQSGLIYIVNLQGVGSVTYRIRGHNTEVINLSWCPTPINIFEDNTQGDVHKDYLLASGAREKTISIWRAGGDARYEIQLSLPHNPLHSEQHRTKLNTKYGHFSVVCWLEPKLLLANSIYGELLAIDLSASMKSTKNPNWRVIHGEHSRGIFAIAAVPRSYANDDENWRASSQHQVWSIAQDRKVVSCTIENRAYRQIDFNVLTQSGFIYCIAACPLDMSFVAFGCGDANIRIWNLSEPHDSTFGITNYWQNIKSKTTALAWHPEKENILAFGTAEGRVAVIDTNSLGKPPIIYRYHHRRTVYTLGWGPSPKNAYDLYSCGDSELIYYNSDKPNDNPAVLEKECTEFAWNPDFSCMVMGFEDGRISFVNNKLEACGKPIFLLKKAIQRFAWHPDSTATDLNYSPMRNYLAVAINANVITIFDMTAIIDNLKNGDPNKDDEKANNKIDKCSNSDGNDADYKVVGMLTGHADRVICLAWSPHVTGRLVSGGYDNTAQVWKIDTMELIASYTGHTGTIYCCMWSPMDADYIITGSGDFTLRVWKLSDQKVVKSEKPEAIKSKPKKKKSAKKSANTILSEPKFDMCEVDCTTELIIDEKVQNSTINGSVNGIAKELKEPKERKKGKKVGFLPTYRNNMNNKFTFLKSCLKLAKKTEGYDDNIKCEGQIYQMSIFGSQHDTLAIVNNEQTTFKEQGHFTVATEMSIWTNNLRQQLQDAVKERRLNDFMVSLAPMLSVKTWQEMCEAYANQLVLESNITKAVNYFLGIHKIYRAIDVLCEAKMFREAYVLAKCKLDSQDLIINNILTDWSSHAIKSGTYEDAAQCFIMLGNLVKAAKYLAKRIDVDYLETAAELAHLGNDYELSQSIADDAVTQALIHDNPNKAENIINKFPYIQYRFFHLETMKEMEKVRNNDSVDSWLTGKVDYNMITTLQNRFNELEWGTSPSAVSKLNAICFSNPSENDQMLWLNVSHQIALASLAPTESKRVTYIVSACEIVSKYEIVHPNKSNEPYTSYLIRLLSVLEPKISQFMNDTQENIYKSLRSYFCLALLNWLVDRLTKNVEKGEISVDSVLELIQKCLTDGLDIEAAKFCTSSEEISKLEAALITAMSNEQKRSVNGENGEEEKKKNSEVLLEQLEKKRTERKKFVDERVTAPPPIIIYGKANGLCSLLQDENVKCNFETLLKEKWNKIIL